jgi:hypothetical protein
MKLSPRSRELVARVLKAHMPLQWRSEGGHQVQCQCGAVGRASHSSSEAPVESWVEHVLEQIELEAARRR